MLAAQGLWDAQREQDASQSPPPPPVKPKTPPNINGMGMLNIEDACYVLGRMSRDTFDRHVRRHLRVKPVNGRDYFTAESIRDFIASGSYKSLA